MRTTTTPIGVRKIATFVGALALAVTGLATPALADTDETSESVQITESINESVSTEAQSTSEASKDVRGVARDSQEDEEETTAPTPAPSACSVTAFQHYANLTNEWVSELNSTNALYEEEDIVRTRVVFENLTPGEEVVFVVASPLYDIGRPWYFLRHKSNQPTLDRVDEPAGASNDEEWAEAFSFTPDSDTFTAEIASTFYYDLKGATFPDNYRLEMTLNYVSCDPNMEPRSMRTDVHDSTTPKSTVRPYLQITDAISSKGSWKISKSVSESSIEVGDPLPEYTVKVTATAAEDKNLSAVGAIRNDQRISRQVTAVEAALTHSGEGGRVPLESGTCTTDPEGPLTLAPGELKQIQIQCEIDDDIADLPDDLRLELDVTAVDGITTSSTRQDATKTDSTWAAVENNVTDGTVEIVDDNYTFDPQWFASVTKGPFTKTFPMEYDTSTIPAGECVTVTSTSSIVAEDPANRASDSVDVEICNTASETTEPVVEPTAEPTEPVVEPTAEPTEPVAEPTEAVLEPVVPTEEPTEPKAAGKEMPVTGVDFGVFLLAGLLGVGGALAVVYRRRVA